MAAVNQAERALELLRGKTEEQRAAGIRRIAARIVVQKSAEGMREWIRVLPSPYERALAFVGAAEGLSEKKR